MSIGVLALLAFNLFLSLAVAIIFIRLTRPPKDDPRLSRGLQLLQSKIAVLEDLSDRTEMQVSQLTGLLQQKILDVQKASQEAELQIERIKGSMEKSKEVAKLFQDKIPHQEIIERQNSIRYMRAARLAHQGKTIDEIASTLDIPAAEVALLVKLNKNRQPEELELEAEDEVLLATEVAEDVKVETPQAASVPKRETEVKSNFGFQSFQFPKI